MSSFSVILIKAYEDYLLALGGKKVPSPYRINVPYQEDKRKNGKSDPLTLIRNTVEIAQEEEFNLDEASVEDIRNFMEKNLLGVDCSGFVYYCLNRLLQETDKGNLMEAGFPEASKTNSKMLASNEFSIPIDKISEVAPGDTIFFTGVRGHTSHIVVVVKADDQEIVYAQSTGIGEIKGVQINNILIKDAFGDLRDQGWTERLETGELRSSLFDPKIGDGVRRLKVLE